MVFNLSTQAEKIYTPVKEKKTDVTCMLSPYIWKNCYRIFTVIRAHLVCSTLPSSGRLSLCNPVKLNGNLHPVHSAPPPFLRSNINKCWAYHSENIGIFICPSQVGRIMLWRCPSVWRHRFHVMTQKVSQLSSWKLAYSFPIDPWKSLFFLGVMTLIFEVSEVKKAKFSFWSIIQNILELSTWNLVQTVV